MALAVPWMSLEIPGLHLNGFLRYSLLSRKCLISQELLFSNRKIVLLENSPSALMKCKYLPRTRDSITWLWKWFYILVWSIFSVPLKPGGFGSSRVDLNVPHSQILTPDTH